MGISYYLRRDDNRTLFELGKYTYTWGDVLGRGRPFVVDPAMQPVLSGYSAQSFRNNEFSGIGVPGGLKGYSRRIAHAIVQWCDGRPFQFVSEDGFDQWMEDETWDYDLAVTGTRYEV